MHKSAIFVTGHRKADASDIEWQTLARSHQTLVIYMGTLKAQVIAEHLQQYGRAANTPVAIISKVLNLLKKQRLAHLQI